MKIINNLFIKYTHMHIHVGLEQQSKLKSFSEMESVLLEYCPIESSQASGCAL